MARRLLALGESETMTADLGKQAGSLGQRTHDRV